MWKLYNFKLLVITYYLLLIIVLIIQVNSNLKDVCLVYIVLLIFSITVLRKYMDINTI